MIARNAAKSAIAGMAMRSDTGAQGRPSARATIRSASAVPGYRSIDGSSIVCSTRARSSVLIGMKKRSGLLMRKPITATVSTSMAIEATI